MRTLPAGMQTELAKRLPTGASRVHLIDVQRSDGTTYFWSTHEGQFLSRLTGAQQLYKPWVKQAPTIKMTRSLKADGGEFKIQNLSGNTIDREVAALFKAGEFEGAYVIYRPWLVPFDGAPFEFHGFVTEQVVGTEDVSVRMLQLFQPNEIPVYDQRQTRDCSWRFNSPQCGYRVGQQMVPLILATIFSANTIGAAGLAMTPNLFKDEKVILQSGTGSGQQRDILSHTATTLTLKSNWTVNPDGTTAFLVTGQGTPKVGLTGVNIFSANTIGNSGLARVVNGDVDAAVFIMLGTGVGQDRAVVSNTATTFSVLPAWKIVPDGTSSFMVVYRTCSKDRASCVTRGVIERFPGVIFLQPQITTINGPTGVGTGGRPGGGGGGGGVGGGGGRSPRMVL